MYEKYNIKLSDIEIDGNKIKGAFLTLQEYALLRNVPYQTIVEEVNSINNRRSFRKTVYYPDIKSILFIRDNNPSDRKHKRLLYKQKRVFNLNSANSKSY